MRLLRVVIDALLRDDLELDRSRGRRRVRHLYMCPGVSPILRLLGEQERRRTGTPERNRAVVLEDLCWTEEPPELT